METTVGKILLKNHVPDSLKSYVHDTTLDKKGIGELFSRLSHHEPDIYQRHVTDLARLGFEVATRKGSSVPLDNLSPLDDKDERFKKLEQEMAKINNGPGTKQDKERKLIELYAEFTKQFDKDLVQTAAAKNHTLAKVMLAGARGQVSQYRQTVGAAILVNDEKGKPILDLPIKHSFAEGLTVPEYLAHSYGVRQGAIATKLSIADSGYMSKQLSRAAMTLKTEEHDCGTNNGISVPVSDRDSIGTYLAHPVANYKRNNEVTATMLADLASKKISEIVVRSPMTCQASRNHHFGAVCQLCAGKREKGTLPPLGSFVGITAATALGEPLAQGQLNTKHTAAGASLGKTVATGFKLIEQLANPRHHFVDKAAVAKEDGKISKIRKLPQGGTEIDVIHGSTEDTYYVPAGFEIYVKEGEKVEAGDVMSGGIINPAEIVKYKGIGEGRVHFANALRRAFEESGMGVNRRNFELISRSAIDHVRVTHPEGLGEHLPDEVVSYQAIEKDYKPRPDSQQVRVDLAKGKYLEEPILHFTIGTYITSKIIDKLKQHHIESIKVHNQPPHFEPEMLRLLDVPATVPDWAHQLYSTYLEKRLIQAVNTGMKSSLKGPSPILGLAYGVGFPHGQHIS